jgi:hypothetical protein
MANVLAGVQGILELADPARPLGQRDKDRLGAVVEEGMATLGRARHLTLGTLPDALPQEAEDWRAQLEEELLPMGVLFRCAFRITFASGSELEPWPGAVLRAYVRSAVRQVLPYVHGGTLTLNLEAGPEGWTIAMSPVELLPEGLTASPGDRPGDIGGRWVCHLGNLLGVSLSCEDGLLTVRVPRP